jgi:hypothetical protein
MTARDSGVLIGAREEEKRKTCQEGRRECTEGGGGVFG